jgi:tetratricopeptide (TPR) repeat protein
MSLLMKALEKAAKDREESGVGPGGASPGAGAAAQKSDLTLEPLAAPPAAAATRASAAPREPPAPARETSFVPRDPPLAQRKPGAPNIPGAPGATRDPAQAATATLLAAGRGDTGGSALDYVRDHPWLIIGTVAAMFLLGYFTYVYLQVKNPGMFAKQPPPAVAQPAPASAGAPAPSAVAPAPSISGLPRDSQPIPLNSLLPRPQDEGTNGREVAPREKAALESPAPSAAKGSIGAGPAPGTPGGTGTRASGAGAAPAAPADAAQARAATSAARTRSATPTSTPGTTRDTIKVTGGTTGPTINPLLSSAYAALNTGNFETSQRLYNQLLRSEPTSIDAMLGLAAIATQQGDSDQAARNYMSVLELDPRNSIAQTGLISMGGRADPLAAESRLKTLIGRDPSAYLYFTLGNLYADQGRWPDAQQAYFQAHHLQPDNPDYAYNLAVGLEHVGQARLALNFYRRALTLAQVNPRTNFNSAIVQERIGKLEKVAE